MDHKQAIALLRNDHFHSAQKEIWADLGCGTGTFTLALADLLKPGSVIHAVDSNSDSLDQIPGSHKKVAIQKHHRDFEKQEIAFDADLDGILMANSLHYIKNKEVFIHKAINWLKKDGLFLLVEYDTKLANPWVPYPLDFFSLQKLFLQTGFSQVARLGEMTSVFGRAKLYAAIVER